MRVRMLPISFVFSRFPRMVRDLAQRLGKQIELTLTGEQTELDKTVLEKIGDPLVHLVRNSIDHGIEKPDVRLAAGKPAAGTLRLNACHRGGNIAVEVSDDGGGLDAERILAKARSRGLVGPNEALADDADLRAHLPARLLHRGADHRRLRPRRRPRRRAPQRQGARRQDRSHERAGQGRALRHHPAAHARHRRRPVDRGGPRELHRAARQHHRVAADQAGHAQPHRRPRRSVRVPRRLRARDPPARDVRRRAAHARAATRASSSSSKATAAAWACSSTTCSASSRSSSNRSKPISATSMASPAPRFSATAPWR